MKIYYAGPLFTMAERQFNSLLAELLRARGHEVFLPQDECDPKGTPGAIAQRCKFGIDNTHVVLACLDGPDPDSGTCWEMGYAHGRSKPVFVFRTDMRLAAPESEGRVNCMLTSIGQYYVPGCHLPRVDLPQLADLIASCIKKKVG